MREILPVDNPLLTTLERVYRTGVGETSGGLPSYFPAGAHPGRYFTRAFVPLRDEPECRWVDRDEAEIAKLVALAADLIELLRQATAASLPTAATA